MRVPFARLVIPKSVELIPQIVVGLLVDHRGMPLEVGCFEGSKAETQTMAEVLSGFTKRHQLENIIVVADAGMTSADNCNKLSDLGFQLIVGSKMSKAPFGMDMTVNGTGEGITDGILSKTTRSWARPKRRKFVGGWCATIQRNGFTTTNTT